MRGNLSSAFFILGCYLNRLSQLSTGHTESFSIVQPIRMKQFLLVLGFISATALFNTPSLFAQNTDPEFSIDVSAEVISSIEMITIQSMQLEQAEAQNNRIQLDPQSSPNAGKMIAIGVPNTEIRLSFLERRELTRRNGSESLIFDYELAGNTQDDQSTAEILDSENRDLEFNSEGRFYIWIGGSVDISTATPGNYQGEFTLEIDYI